MAKRTFRGGIHPYDGKELSKDKPVRKVCPKGELVYPLSQHIGAPAVCLVKKGDHVLAGQKIAEAGGFVSVPIHASVSGTVKNIEPRLTATGTMVNSVIVENDGAYEETGYPACKPLKDLEKAEILNMIKEAGVVGMGGAGFPTHVKLSPKEPEKIEYIIVNCAECEPYLTSDYRRMLDAPEKIIGGLKIILKLFPTAKGVIAIEDNKKDAIALMEKKAEGEENIQILALKTKYPQGAERMLIYAVTGRKINSSMLPADAGCIVDNCETVYAINRAVTEGKPVTERIVTVTGDAITDPQNFSVYTGTSYQELVDAAGGFKQEPEKVISGGPMMGFAMFDLNVPCTKTSSAILCMTKDEAAMFEPTACINCGRCVSACPEHLIPARLADLAERHDEAAFDKMGGLECCECGCCSYSCPARRHLTQEIKSMRRIVMASKRKK